MAPPARKAARSADFVPPGNDAVVWRPDDFRGLTGDAFKEKSFWQRMHPIHVPLLTITPILAIIGILTADFVWQTYAFAVFYYFFTGFGITAGERAAVDWPRKNAPHGSCRRPKCPLRSPSRR